MLWLPRVNDEVEKAAEPLLNAPLPMLLAPSKKVTVPVAVPGVTVAVKVTDWPERDGLTEEMTAVVVLFFTVTVAEPLMPPLVTGSVAVTVLLPSAVRVTPLLKVCTPLSPAMKVYVGGKDAEPSLLVM